MKQSPEWVAKRIAAGLKTKMERGPLPYRPKNISPEERLRRSERLKQHLREHPEHLEKLRAASRQKRGPLPDYRRQQISAYFKGKKQSAELIAKRAAALRGHHVSVETRAKIAAAHRQRQISAETRQRMAEGQRGRHHSLATREKMSKAAMGHFVSAETRRKLAAASRGRRQTIEQLAKNAAAQRLRKGPLSARWKGGITWRNTEIRNAEAMRLWRKDVFHRDNHTCRICGLRGGYLNAHHILELAKFSQFRLELWNGRTLCRPCHAAVHRTARAEARALGRTLQ